MIATREPSQEYHEALGEFIEFFAIVEQTVFDALQAISGVSDATARAIFNGTHTSDGMNLLKRVAEANPNFKHEKQLEIMAIHLKAITDVRNDLVHYGSTFSPNGEQVLTRARRAFRPEKLPPPKRISSRKLRFMTEDLAMIASFLIFWSARQLENVAPQEDQKNADDLKRSWKYRPA